MFLPFIYASLTVVSACLGTNFWVAAAAVSSVAVGVLVLGLGHMTRLIW